MENSKTEGDRAEDEKQRTMAYLLFGIDLEDEKERAPGWQIGMNSQKEVNAGQKAPQTGNVNDSHNDARNENNQKIRAVLDQIERQIPVDSAMLKETPLFTAALHALQWQRDNYLAGREYADWRKRDKDRGRSNPSPFRIPYDSNALVHSQLRPILADFIPSETVSRALTPIVADLPSGIMYDIITNSTISVIRGQGNNLNTVVKSQLLAFLCDPLIRNKIKSSTQGLIIDKTENRRKSG